MRKKQTVLSIVDLVKNISQISKNAKIAILVLWTHQIWPLLRVLILSILKS